MKPPKLMQLLLAASMTSFPFIAANANHQLMNDQTQASYMMNPYAGMYGSMGNVYSPYYTQFHAQDMAAMSGMQGIYNNTGLSTMAEMPPIVPHMINPYAGMYGSMGNVYSPYYTQFHAQYMAGMSGMQGINNNTGLSAMSGMAPNVPHVTNPYAGMYGSMGNVYSPYYRYTTSTEMIDFENNIPEIPGSPAM